MKLLATLKSFVGTAVNVAAKNPMRTLAIGVAVAVFFAVIFSFARKKEGMRDGGRLVPYVPSKYPHWGWRGTKNEGLRCKNNDTTGCTTGWVNGVLTDLEPASTANLVPWPTAQIPGGPGQLLLTAYKQQILYSHKGATIKTMADIEKYWGLYRNPHNGLYEILVMSADVPAKQAASAETWRRTKLMIDLVAKTNLPQKFVKKLQDFAAIPKKFGGLSPITECEPTIGRPGQAGAYANSVVVRGEKVPHVSTLWRVPKRDVAPGDTMADKRFGIIIHETTHVACGNKNCIGLDGTGHCGEFQVVEVALRKVCAKHGLKKALPAKTRKFFADKCAKFAASLK